MVKKENARKGLVNTLCSTSNDENESLQITLFRSDLTVSLVGTLDNYTASENASSKFNLLEPNLRYLQDQSNIKLE